MHTLLATFQITGNREGSKFRAESERLLLEGQHNPIVFTLGQVGKIKMEVLVVEQSCFVEAFLNVTCMICTSVKLKWFDINIVGNIDTTSWLGKVD